jgi:hypothetical protein
MITTLTARGSRLALLALIWLAWHVPIVVAEPPPASIWETDLSAACSRAQAEAKPLVVYLSSSADEEHASICREFERGPLASPAMDGFRNWAVLARVDLAAPVPDGTVGEMLRAIDLTETPSVVVVVHHRDGWQAYGQCVGGFESSDFIRILRGDVAHAMIAIARQRQQAMSPAELAQKRAEVYAECDQLRSASDAVAISYDYQLARIRSGGQFNAAAFIAATGERRALQRRWVAAVVELAALPDFRDDPLCEMVLNGLLLDYDVSRRLATDLAALDGAEQRPNPLAAKAAQLFVRAADEELEAASFNVQKTVADAGRLHSHQSRHCQPTRRPAPPSSVHD